MPSANMVASSILMGKKVCLWFVNDDNDAAVWTIKTMMVDDINHKLIKDTIKNSHYSKKPTSALPLQI